MRVSIEGEAKETAALVLAVQERQEESIDGKAHLQDSIAKALIAGPSIGVRVSDGYGYDVICENIEVLIRDARSGVFKTTSFRRMNESSP